MPRGARIGRWTLRVATGLVALLATGAVQVCVAGGAWFPDSSLLWDGAVQPVQGVTPPTTAWQAEAAFERSRLAAYPDAPAGPWYARYVSMGALDAWEITWHGQFPIVLPSRPPLPIHPWPQKYTIFVYGPSDEILFIVIR